MTSYNDILNNTIDQDSPFTTTLLTYLRDNPIALAEGASGAPKIADKTFFVSGSFSATTAGFDPFSGVWVDASQQYVSANSALQISFSDNGSTFYGTTSIASVDSSTTLSMVRAFFDFATGDYKWVGTGSGSISGSGTVAGLSLAVTHVRITFSSGGGANGAAILNPQGGESSS